MDFLKNLWSGVQSTWNNLFSQQNQQVISPLPNTPSIGGKPVQGPGLGYGGPRDFFFPQSNPTPQNDGGFSGGGGGGGGGVFATPGDPTQMSQEQRQYLWEQAGHSGIAPIGYGGEGGGGNPVDSMLQALVDPLQAEIEGWWKRLDEYDRNNPFAFDEALARASAEERLNPYFNATMNEFMTGIRRSSQRSVEDMTRTIGELNVDASKLSEKERFNTQEAIRSSEEGFAGAGLFFSGKRARASGVEEVGGIQKQEDIATTLGRGVASQTRGNTRLQEDLALQEARQKRLTGAERTTALETDISKQKREAELQRGLERLQFAGKIPGASPADQLTLENQFLTGLT